VNVKRSPVTGFSSVWPGWIVAVEVMAGTQPRIGETVHGWKTLSHVRSSQSAECRAALLPALGSR
jgi:hypothetical protein